jgi:hypothetical protein
MFQLRPSVVSWFRELFTGILITILCITAVEHPIVTATVDVTLLERDDQILERIQVSNWCGTSIAGRKSSTTNCQVAPSNIEVFPPAAAAETAPTAASHGQRTKKHISIVM